MKRRYVLLSGIGALCGLAGWRFARATDESAVVKVVYKRLDYLQLDDDGVHRFARDIETQHLISSPRLHAIDAAGALYTQSAWSAHNWFNNALRHGEERVVTQYLISSDFFWNGADETRTVHYLGYFDPRVACRNPFARSMLNPIASYPRVPA